MNLTISSDHLTACIAGAACAARLLETAVAVGKGGTPLCARPPLRLLAVATPHVALPEEPLLHPTCPALLRVLHRAHHVHAPLHLRGLQHLPIRH